MRSLTPIIVAFALLCAPFAGPARAGSDPAMLRAKRFFKAGSVAYGRGRYGEATRAFEEAYRAVKNPSIAFSMAQAYRRQFFVDRKPSQLNRALELYQDYVDDKPGGKRRLEAVDQIQALEAIRAQLAPSSAEVNGPAQKLTELLIYAEVDGVIISIDGGPGLQTPAVVAVKSGAHTISARAPGHFGQKKTVTAVAHRLTPIPLELMPKPAKLEVRTDTGADVFVDGVLAGTTPMKSAVELSPGTRRIDVVRAGHNLASRQLVVAKNEALSLELPLEISSQRTVAHVLLASAAGLVAAGAGTTAAAFAFEGSAAAATDLRASRNITAAELRDLNGAVSRRNSLRTASVLLFSTAIVSGIVGGALYLFDTPDLPAQSIINREAPAAAFTF